MNDYQKGIYDLQNVFRKHGSVLVGDIGLKKAYHGFLKKHSIKPRRGTKHQVENLRNLTRYGYPPTEFSQTVSGATGSITIIDTIIMK